jgi:hypothetical protein
VEIVGRPWRAYYADGRRLDSRTTAVADLPRDGLAAVVVYLDAPYKNIYHGEFIWHSRGEWGTALALFDAQVYGEYVFPGIMMPDADFDALQREAMESSWQ